MTAILFKLLPYALAAAAIFSGGFGTAWKWQESTITEIKLEHAHESLALEQDAADEREADRAALAAATNDKVVRDSRNRAAAAGAANAGYGLRIASSETVKAAQADPGTCSQSIAIYDTVLDSMAASGRRIAAEADLWESDALMLKARLTQHEAAQ